MSALKVRTFFRPTGSQFPLLAFGRWYQGWKRPWRYVHANHAPRVTTFVPRRTTTSTWGPSHWITVAFATTESHGLSPRKRKTTVFSVGVTVRAMAARAGEGPDRQRETA